MTLVQEAFPSLDMWVALVDHRCYNYILRVEILMDGICRRKVDDIEMCVNHLDSVVVDYSLYPFFSWRKNSTDYWH